MTQSISQLIQQPKKQPRGFSEKIIRSYLFGASILLAFYMFAFHTGILQTENTVVERRINIAAPYHFKRFESGQSGAIKIDPLLTIYENYGLLPPYIQSEISATWTGSKHVLLDDEREFQVVAKNLLAVDSPTVVYAIEATNSVEMDDKDFVLIEISLGLVGVILFVVTAFYMVKAARKVASPFLQVADQLATDSLSSFEQIEPSGEKTRELEQILTALNSYRFRLAKHIEREQSFTRYVSHELRTPMMIIKGAVSNLRHDAPGKTNKSVDKIVKATEQMEELTKTFLILARGGDLESDKTTLDEAFMHQLGADHNDAILANQIDFHWQLREPIELAAHPQLVNAMISNLLKNAFACSENGTVTLLISSHCIEVIDNGIGLQSKPRGHEGFGIGLVLVNDVCSRYGWVFKLTNNETSGCTASINFDNAIAT